MGTEGKLNLCNSSGLYSKCKGPNREDQIECKHYEKATHASRCMYNIDGRCDNPSAQKEVKK
jgi:hypothetical protein